MSPITAGDFQSELPLHPSAQALLATFFEQGWPDPSKVHHQSANLRNLIQTAKESIASNLGIQTTELEIVGELGFGFQSAVSGIMQNRNLEFTYSEVDRQIIHAFARLFASSGGKISELKPDKSGLVDFSQSSPDSILIWQSTNRETGVKQQLPPSNHYQKLFADMTASYELQRLPSNWDCALWDPRSFGGPQGIALLGISNHGGWQNPGPVMDKRRVFGSYSKPLLLATAVALENWVKDRDLQQTHIAVLNRQARQLISEKLPNAIIAGDSHHADPRFLAFCLPGIIAEELLRKLEGFGFLVDAGSACGGGALSPSHVLTAMGLPMDGNMRITLKPEHSEEMVFKLIERIAASA